MGRCEICKNDAIDTQSGVICSNKNCVASMFTVSHMMVGTPVRMDEAFTVPIVACRNPIYSSAAESQAQSTSQIQGLHTIAVDEENAMEQNQTEREEFEEIRHQARGQFHSRTAGASRTSQTQAVLEVPKREQKTPSKNDPNCPAGRKRHNAGSGSAPRSQNNPKNAQP